MRRFIMLAALLLMLLSQLPVSPAQAALSDFGIESVSASLSSVEAGAHPDFTTTLELKKDSEGSPFADTRDIRVDLPPGLLANLGRFPQCTTLQLVEEEVCPQDSQIGVTEIVLFGLGTFTEPVYNMTPTSRTVARLGLIAGIFPTLIDAEVRSQNDYGATVNVRGAASVYPVMSTVTTVWGVPADPSHDSLRLTPKEAFEQVPIPGGGRSSGLRPAPLMTNPTSCGGGRQVLFAADSYSFPGQFSELAAPFPSLAGCERLGFQPQLAVQPTSAEAGAPTGLDVTLTLPQDESPTGLATAALRDAKVVLPAGMTIASGAAAGLAACDATEAGYKSRNPAHCPEAAKLGTVELETPVLAEPLHGALYQRTPEPGHLFRVWLVIDDLGVHAALPGELEADPETGQLTAVFAENPQVPLSELRLHVFGGSRAPLANPPACGTYQTSYEFTPWSGTAPVVDSAPMRIDEGCAGGGFSPRLSGGSTNPLAGAFSPFLTELTREGDEENVAGLQVTLPPGVLAKLAGVALCDDASAPSGNCPPTSQVGSLTAAVGPGPTPLWIPQPGKQPTAVYLAGPYEGGPYSIVVKTPAQAGPFDLGTVVVRAAIEVDPETARVTVKSDPLPQFLQGVPISYRMLHVDIDRSDFALNPTSCAPMALAAKAISTGGAIANPTSRFQVGGCRELGFAPRLSLVLEGPTNRGAHPALRAVLRLPTGGANIARAQVTLPRSEFLEQSHIRTVCTRVQFAAHACPKGSIYGYAQARTPLLERSLRGPVYLRSSTHELPDLVAALRGQIEVDVDGRIDSVGGGIRTTFDSVPDAPVRTFALTMKGGAQGLLVNSTNLCTRPSRAIADFTGQNGKLRTLHPEMRSDCAEPRRAKHKHPHKSNH